MRLAVTGLVALLVIGAVVLFTLHVLEEAESPTQQAKPERQTDRAAWLEQLKVTDWRRLLGKDGNNPGIERADGSATSVAGAFDIAISAFAHAAGTGQEEPLREETIRTLFELASAVSASQGEPWGTLLDVMQDPDDFSEQVRAFALSFLVPAYQAWQKQREAARAGLEDELRKVDSDADRKEVRRFFELMESMPAPSQRTRDNWAVLERVSRSRHD